MKKLAPVPETMVRGIVSLSDGSVPDELIDIYAGCAGGQNLVAVPDSKGRFSFDPSLLGDARNSTACTVRASLEGYRSQPEPLDIGNKQSGKPLKLVLQPFSQNANGLTSAADEQAANAQKKSFRKALDEAAKTDWKAAIATLEKVTSADPRYSSAWLALGSLQWRAGEHTAAEKSFLQAIRADQKFALPLIEVAALEASQGDWQNALDHSQKAITLNPAAFPSAYALNAMANVSLQNVDAAEKSAREGLKLDVENQYPELQYSLGIVLYSKGQITGATKYLRSYVARLPNGPNAAAARSELAQSETAAGDTAARDTAARDTSAQAGHPPVEKSTQSPLAGVGPALSAVQAANAPLLSNAPDYTCLETISRDTVDARGVLHPQDLVRVEVGISGGKEIYSDVGAKRFSNESLASRLGYTFSTTGLFSSIARSLIAANGVTIEFAGNDVLDQEPVFRYRFRVVSSQAGWFLLYGNESGRAGEEGSFLVDREKLILRRVAVRAIDIPRNIKLNALDTVVDYLPETIAGQRVLLPSKADVHAEERSRLLHHSGMSFNHCRAFTTESTISFEGNGPQLQNADRVAETELPPGLDVVIAPVAAITPASAAANDFLSAVTVEPVVVKGREIVPRGAALEGHLWPRDGGEGITIEIDRVKSRTGWSAFYAQLVSVASTGVRIGASVPAIPGVANLVSAENSLAIPPGTRMTWKTEPLFTPVESRPPQLHTAVQMH